VALITSMDQPLGRFAGNALEVFECVEIMKNKTHIGADGHDLYEDTRELSLQLSAHMIHLSGKTKCVEDAYKLAVDALVSGKALEIFEKMCGKQGGNLAGLAFAKKQFAVTAASSGYLSSFNVEKVGLGGIVLKAGRRITEDIIDPLPGIEFHKKIGDTVNAGDTIYTIHYEDESLVDGTKTFLNESFTISTQKPLQHKLIKEVLL
jgi:pyrimidine-nucleoside phosphorylase